MQLRVQVIAVALIAAVLSACAGAPSAATLNDMPAYPGAVELKPGESTLGDTLAQNNQADAALRGQLGTGGKTEQKGFSLPQDTKWDAVRGFYDEKLKGLGWGTDSMVSGIMEQANQNNDMVKTALWKKGTQTVTVIMVTSPTDATDKELVLSLSSQ